MSIANIQVLRPGVNHQLTPAGASASKELGQSVGVVRVNANADVTLTFGKSGVAAVATDMPVPAGTVEYFAVPINDGGTWVAVFGTATVNVTEMSK